MSEDQAPTFKLIQHPLERQLRGLNVALRGAATERTWRHAADAVALINEVTDLTLRAEDLLKTLLEGAESGSNGQEVLDSLLELGVQRRLVARGSLVVEDGVGRFTRPDDDLRDEVRGCSAPRATRRSIATPAGARCSTPSRPLALRQLPAVQPEVGERRAQPLPRRRQPVARVDAPRQRVRALALRRRVAAPHREPRELEPRGLEGLAAAAAQYRRLPVAVTLALPQPTHFRLRSCSSPAATGMSSEAFGATTRCIAMSFGCADAAYVRGTNQSTGGLVAAPATGASTALAATPTHARAARASPSAPSVASRSPSHGASANRQSAYSNWSK